MCAPLVLCTRSLAHACHIHPAGADDMGWETNDCSPRLDGRFVEMAIQKLCGGDEEDEVCTVAGAFDLSRKRELLEQDSKHGFMAASPTNLLFIA